MAIEERAAHCDLYVHILQSDHEHCHEFFRIKTKTLEQVQNEVCILDILACLSHLIIPLSSSAEKAGRMRYHHSVRQRRMKFI
jgi:hypothetical protein